MADRVANVVKSPNDPREYRLHLFIKLVVIKDYEVRSTGRVVGSWKNELCEEKQIENQSDTFLAELRVRFGVVDLVFNVFKIEFRSETDCTVPCMEQSLVIHLENGLTALLISDTHSAIHSAHTNSNLSTTDDDDVEDPGSDEIEDESDDDDDVDGVFSKDADVTVTGGSEEEKDESEDTSRKYNDTNMSAAALCIGVGSFSDPDNIPGLAHFLEHMVFMGSEKYPDENEFDVFIKKHGGSDNACTDCERCDGAWWWSLAGLPRRPPPHARALPGSTNLVGTYAQAHLLTTFVFDVRRKYFKETLERFAQLFISPLLKEDTVEREIQAVDSEYRMNYQSDSVRKMQLLSLLVQEGHPFGKFLWGNEETLKNTPEEKGVDVKTSLRDFQQRMYSAQFMTLAVISEEPLDDLEKMVCESFSQIPNK
ncbi:Nardilysin [Acropora cervicornis]|uniref:Nardilysin n=1 Tax=Acropora cervicornis TaxID=6130 RepID=A0AAD9R135_ACRCE|nr:Nardilysin [Acropora cervicornis]